MVNVCVVYGCHNRSTHVGVKRSFHCFPAVTTKYGEKTHQMSIEHRRLWIARVARKDWLPTKYSKVCSDHFVSGKPADLYNQCHPDWAPSLKLAPTREDKPSECSPISLERYARTKERQHIKMRYSAARSLLELADPIRIAPPIMCASDSNPKKSSCNFLQLGKLHKETTHQGTEPSTTSDPLINKIREDYQQLTTEKLDLRRKLSDFKITPESLKDKDDRVKYYTGLPGYLSMMAVFQFLSPHITNNGRTVLTNFPKFLMVMMKLRLDLSVQDLAYRFNVSASTVSRTVNSVIHVMYVRMKHFIKWPDRDQLQLTMPMEFRKNFGLKVAVIIDCFEIFIERPSDLLARAETWSQYKHHNTIKFSIGITPQGIVSFLSPAWGGRSSDKQITENCDLLKNLLPGDLVIADRGFDIAESVGLMCAQVKIPAFTKGKQQLSAVDVEETRRIAHVRIHVERVIGLDLVRNKYTILQGKLPIDYLQCECDEVPLVDKIVTVCCALTNLCESVVPFN